MQNIAWEVVSNDPYSCVSTLNTTEIEPEIQLNLYPNSSSGEVTIEISESVELLTVTDMQGKRLIEQVPTSNQLRIDLAPGIYNVQVYSDSGVISKRLLVQ